ncbi:MAG TPA: hypothetical protein VJB06_03825, partial [archaeon]|nr:hypothetical protein [archaeon]
LEEVIKHAAWVNKLAGAGKISTVEAAKEFRVLAGTAGIGYETSQKLLNIGNNIIEVANENENRQKAVKELQDLMELYKSGKLSAEELAARLYTLSKNPYLSSELKSEILRIREEILRALKEQGRMRELLVEPEAQQPGNGLSGNSNPITAGLNWLGGLVGGIIDKGKEILGGVIDIGKKVADTGLAVITTLGNAAIETGKGIYTAVTTGLTGLLDSLGGSGSEKKKPDNGPDLGILGSFGNLLDIFKPTEPAEPNKNPEPKATEEKKTEEPKQAGTGLLLKDIEIKPLANKKRDSKTIMAELQIFLTRLLSLDKTNPASKREAESLFSDFLGWLSNLLSEFGNTADSAFQELKLFYSDITSALLAGNLGEAMGRWFGKLEKSIFSYFGNIKTGLLDIGMLDFFSKLFGFSRIRSNRSLSGLLERGGNMFSLARPSELLDKRKTGSFSSRKSPSRGLAEYKAGGSGLFGLGQLFGRNDSVERSFFSADPKPRSQNPEAARRDDETNWKNILPAIVGFVAAVFLFIIGGTCIGGNLWCPVLEPPIMVTGLITDHLNNPLTYTPVLLHGSGEINKTLTLHHGDFNIIGYHNGTVTVKAELKYYPNGNSVVLNSTGPLPSLSLIKVPAVEMVKTVDHNATWSYVKTETAYKESPLLQNVTSKNIVFSKDEGGNAYYGLQLSYDYWKDKGGYPTVGVINDDQRASSGNAHYCPRRGKNKDGIYACNNPDEIHFSTWGQAADTAGHEYGHGIARKWGLPSMHTYERGLPNGTDPLDEAFAHFASVAVRCANGMPDCTKITFFQP